MTRRVVITGASSGIGAATARAFAADGCAVWLTFSGDQEGAANTAGDCAGLGAEDVQVSRLDLRSPKSISELVDHVAEAWGELHVLVNNGGVCPYTPYDAIDASEWDLVLETNSRGAFFLSRAVLPLLRIASVGGSVDTSIVNVASIAGQVGSLKTGIHYAASKGALLAITKSFARILAPERIRVNAVTPGPITSKITNQLSVDDHSALSGTVPLGRFGDADEVAWVVAGLASPNASFVTGATYDVNGGTRID